jgi:hypothetical protein
MAALGKSDLSDMVEMRYNTRAGTIGPYIPRARIRSWCLKGDYMRSPVSLI